jgi:radical SAM protein with 4Fe4S-binding SPASM domain
LAGTLLIHNSEIFIAPRPYMMQNHFVQLAETIEMETTAPFKPGGILHATINGHRFHLRLKDPWELNPLWIDGQHMLLLDKVAAETFAYIIEGMWQFQRGAGDRSEDVRNFAVEMLYKKYHKSFMLFNRVTREKIRANVDRIFGSVMSAADGGCPVEGGLAPHEVSHEKWAAPARMDLALTYKCNLDCPHCYVDDGRKNGVRELDADKWKQILDKLWEIGIPNVVFTGGEPTLRPDLVELVAYAEQFVTGLVTNGTNLEALAEPLKNASLDYVQVTLESHIPEIHNKITSAPAGFDAFSKTAAGIKKALSLKMHVITNTTLTNENAKEFPALLEFGKSIGLKNMACNSLICSGRGIAAKKAEGLTEPELAELLKSAAAKAGALDINLMWFTPTCYNKLNPLELGLGKKECSAAAYNMTIQPDGTVLPCQSWPESVGGILADPWEKIWTHPVSQKLRVHGFAGGECMKCASLALCGGGCPLDKEAAHE